MYDDTFLINIDLLDQCLSLKLYSSKSYINKERLRLSILELKRKCAIRFEIVNDKLFTSNTSTVVSGLVQCWTEKSKCKRFNKDADFVGYEECTYSDFNRVDDIFDFYIYVSVKRFDSIGGRNCSDEEWSLLLGVSESTVRRRLDKLIKNKIIYKKSGKWESNKKQGKNTYSTKPFDDVEDGSSVDIENVQEDVNYTPLMVDVDIIDIYKLPDGIPERYMCEQSKNKSGKNFIVKDLRTDILDGNKLYTEHYFYAHQYKELDPEVFEAYSLSRVRLEKKKPDFFKEDDKKWNKHVNELNIKENEKNRGKMIEKMINEKEHIINLVGGNFCYADEVKDWNKVSGFEIKDNTYNFKRGEEFSEFAVGIIRSRRVMNQSVFNEIRDSWRVKVDREENDNK